MAPNTATQTPTERAAEVLEIPVEKVLGTRVESTGGLIAVTANGEKVRITPSDEIELLVGPGAQPENFEPPEPPPAPEEDLPSLEDTRSPAVVAAVEAKQAAAADTGLEWTQPQVTGGLKAIEDDDARKSGDHFDYFKGEDGQFYFRRVAPNGEIVAQSEGYKLQKDAKAEAERQADGLEVVKADA